MKYIKKAVYARAEEFRAFGSFYNLNEDSAEVKYDEGAGWKGGFTREPLIDRCGCLGITETTEAVPFIVEEMERHLHTQESMMCIGSPIVFLAAPQSEETPSGENSAAFILLPGEVAVINRGIWHSPAHGMEGPATYYWMAEAYEGEPTVWAKLKDGSVEVRI